MTAELTFVLDVDCTLVRLSKSASTPETSETSCYEFLVRLLRFVRTGKDQVLHLPLAFLVM
jgi:hypothetical protein